MDLKELIKKFEKVKILNQKFRKNIKPLETTQLQIKPAHNINEDILDELRRSQIQNAQNQKVITRMTIALIILGILTLVFPIHNFVQTSKQNKEFREIKLLKGQLKDNTSMLLKQSRALDSLYHQVRILEQSLQKDSLK